MYYNAYLRTNNALQQFFYPERLQKESLIMPYLLTQSNIIPQCTQYGSRAITQSMLYEELEEYVTKGLRAIFLSIYTATEYTISTIFLEECSYVCDTIYHIKKQYPHLVVIVDSSTSLCGTNSYFGIERNGVLNIDATIDILTELSILYAKAGADVLAHSGMIHPLTKSIRKTLQSHSMYNVAIMAYAIQASDIFSGTLYSTLDTMLCISEEHYMAIARHEMNNGVDILAVSPLNTTLDAVATITKAIELPLFVFHTNTEYASLQCAIANELIEERSAIFSFCSSALRAGAKAIITPYTTRILTLLATDNK